MQSIMAVGACDEGLFTYGDEETESRELGRQREHTPKLIVVVHPIMPELGRLRHKVTLNSRTI